MSGVCFVIHLSLGRLASPDVGQGPEHPGHRVESLPDFDRLGGGEVGDKLSDAPDTTVDVGGAIDGAPGLHDRDGHGGNDRGRHNGGHNGKGPDAPGHTLG